jgi:putative ABC transport system permease protein
MRFSDIIKRSLRNLLTSKARTILTALAIAVGTFALTLTLGASNGAKDYANNIVKSNFDPTELIVAKDKNLFSRQDASKPQVYNPSFGSVTTFGGGSRQVEYLNNADIAKIASTPGVSSVQPNITVSLQYVTRDGQKKYIGTLATYNSYQKPTLLAGSIPDNIPNGQVILPQGFLSSLGFSSASSAIGQNIRLSVQNNTSLNSALINPFATSATQDSSKSQEAVFKIIAVSETPSTSISAQTSLYMYSNLNVVESLNNYIYSGTSSYQKYLEAYAKVTDGSNASKLNKAQALIKKEGYSVQSVVDTEKLITQFISVIEGIVTLFGLIAIIASLFGVVNTMYISVLQRTREIGLMKALGMHRKDISWLFRIEAGLIGLFGGMIGSALAIGIGTALNPFISNKLSLGTSKLLIFKASQIVILIIVLAVIAVFAGLLPARKAAKLDPIEALRTE